MVFLEYNVREINKKNPLFIVHTYLCYTFIVKQTGEQYSLEEAKSNNFLRSLTCFMYARLRITQLKEEEKQIRL